MTSLAKELSKKQNDINHEIETVNNERDRIENFKHRCPWEISDDIPKYKLLPKLISDEILKSLKKEKGIWNADNSMVYVKIKTPLVLKYTFDEFDYYWTQNEQEYYTMEKIYDSIGIQTNNKLIYYNINETELENINNEIKHSGFELLVLSANPDYGTNIKLNAHAILRVI